MEDVYLVNINDKNKSGMKILIVDDDDLLRNFYSRVLLVEGYGTVCAADVGEAIKILEDGKHDIKLAIIDILMPVKTGWELIQYMKGSERFRNVPIIAITAFASSLAEYEKVKGACQLVMHKGEFDLIKFKEVIKAQIGK